MLLEEDVTIRFYSKENVKSHDFVVRISDLNIDRVKDFKFVIENTSFGEPTYIELQRENKWLRHSRWLCDYVKLTKVNSDDVYMFPINRCVLVGAPLKLKEYDTSLPQEDANSEQRQTELKRKEISYGCYKNRKTEMIMVRRLPYSEAFSYRYQWDIDTEAFKLIAKSAWLELSAGKCETIEDIEKLYRPPLLPIPEGIHRWKSDRHFANQRLTGCNPAMIRLCNRIPENFKVDIKMLESTFLEGSTIDDVIKENRLFIVNHEILKNLPVKEGGNMVAPLALFFVNKDANLMPIAIQLFQDPAPTNPVFYPTDPKYTWLMAKCYFNMADASVHEASSHLGFTHLIGEVIVIATNRCLSPSHPIYRLLAPHFLYLLAINKAGLGPLLSPHAWAEIPMLVGSGGLSEIIKRRQATWRLDVEGSLLADLEDRGVADSEVLPKYYYRDDALRLHGAISRYVKQIVKQYYDTPEKIVDDYELQDWVAFMASQDNEDDMVGSGDGAGTKGGIKGLPHDGHFETAKEISDVVTNFIFIFSATHAAVNFGQYDNYAFPPAYPGWINGQPPQDKTPLTEKDIIAKLPNKKRILKTMSVTRLLSMHDTKPLGDFEVQYLFDPNSVKALEGLRADLKAIEHIIQSENKNRYNKYEWLLPSNVPNSISI
ncbi:allene oxide synthase-lipoxygenase protein-like [Lytechinus pictus]|uniref:allene oxide synthase-lipoxygenase protein-like n=1 Tax=Lytechinus pictus TaxID=7653 RepID=UPI0030BA175D